MYQDESGELQLCPPCFFYSIIVSLDHFCNYGIKQQCSSRVYGFSTEGEFSVTSLSSSYVTSMFCKGECEAGTISHSLQFLGYYGIEGQVNTDSHCAGPCPVGYYCPYCGTLFVNEMTTRYATYGNYSMYINSN